MGEARSVADPKKYEKQIRQNIAMTLTPEQILHSNKEQLLSMQHQVGLGGLWGRIEFPKAFMPAGQNQFDSARIHKLEQVLPPGMPLDGSDAISAWSEILRFVLARLTQPGPRRTSVSSYSTCKIDLVSVKAFVPMILQLSVKEGHFWSRVSETMVVKTDVQKNTVTVINHYHRIGALPDTFRQDSTIVANETERDRFGEPEHETAVARNKMWQPLPMEFVAQVGWRSLRIIKNVAPALLDALEEALEVPEVSYGVSGKKLAKDKARWQTLQARDVVIKEWTWKDELGEPLNDLGFVPARLNHKTGPMNWPPSTYGQAMAFAHQVVKPAHLWVVLLGNGPRSGEAVSMREDCLTPALNGNFRWKGRTYKMTGITGGREIDAIVPDIVTQSLLQQACLARVTKRDKGRKGNALWVGANGTDHKVLNDTLNNYVDFLGLRDLLGEDNTSCHEHRFRKTLAWIVAVSLTNSIMILKDCFGHTDAVMTLLKYIASDPSIAREVIKVQKELTIMMAVDVITDRETIGGPGAPALRQRADAQLKRIGKSKFEPQDAYEFARRETFEGRAWMVIAPGILCTAPHDVTQVSTPCAVGQKRHNPANCKTGCDWQLLLSGYHATQADDTVDYALKNLQQAIDNDDEASIAFWAGQAKAWLYRYDEVAEKWKDHPLVVSRVPRPSRIMMKEAA